MTVGQAEKALGRKFVLNEDDFEDPASCSMAARPSGGGVVYMFRNDRVVRVESHGSSVTTAQGATIGTTESQLRKIYGSKAVFTPHPYDNDAGHYVTIAYPRTRMIFETLQGKVTSFRVGLPGPVDYIEGCS